MNNKVVLDAIQTLANDSKQLDNIQLPMSLFATLGVPLYNINADLKRVRLALAGELTGEEEAKPDDGNADVECEEVNPDDGNAEVECEER